MKKRFLMLFMMLLLSALVVTAAGYAWFTASAQSEVHGTQVKAETQGVLKVWTENDAKDPETGIATFPNAYANYTTYMDFSDEDDPFYNPGYAEHTMKDQSGNGSEFYQTVSAGAFDQYAEVSGLGVALVYNLYFSAYTGSDESQLRDIYLSDMDITNVAPGTLATSIRVAFLRPSDSYIYGIYTDSSDLNFVTAADYQYNNSEAPFDLLTGTPSTKPGAGEITATPGNIGYVTPEAPTSTTPRRLYAGDNVNGTTICQVNSNVIQPSAATVKVVIWIEGADSNTTDLELSRSVTIDMVFQSRMPANTFNLTTMADGGIHTNPATIEKANFYAAGDTGFSNELGVVLDAPTKNGYTFDGWYKNAGLTEQVTLVDGTGYTIKQADFTNQMLTVYAKWTSVVTPTP